MIPIVASVTPNQTKFGPLLFPGELERAIQELGDLGYDGIELSLRTVRDINQKELKEQLNRAKLRLISVATGQSFIEDGYALFHHDVSIRNKTVARLKQFIDLVADFGGNTVILGGIRGNLDYPDKNQQFKWGSEAIDQCLAHAEKKKVMLVLEAINRYETNLMNTVDSCTEFITERNSSYLRVLGDTFHMNIEEVSINEALNRNAAYIGVIHTADSNRCAPGLGHINFPEVLRDIDKYPSLQYLGVEVLPIPDSSSCARSAIETLKGIV
jgi:sugar phosphate isomerase/epimerase